MKTTTKTTTTKRVIRKSTTAKAKPAATGRVSVRLKPVLAEKLAEAQREQGLSVTQVVEAALESHFAATPTKPRMTLLQALEKHKLIGCLDLGPDASANYKQLVLDSVAEKYGYR